MIFPLQNPDQEVPDRSQLQTHGWGGLGSGPVVGGSELPSEQQDPCTLTHTHTHTHKTLSASPAFPDYLEGKVFCVVTVGDRWYFGFEFRTGEKSPTRVSRSLHKWPSWMCSSLGELFHE